MKISELRANIGTKKHKYHDVVCNDLLTLIIKESGDLEVDKVYEQLKDERDRQIKEYPNNMKASPELIHTHRSKIEGLDYRINMIAELAGLKQVIPWYLSANV